jgi:hypothetical protein
MSHPELNMDGAKHVVITDHELWLLLDLCRITIRETPSCTCDGGRTHVCNRCVAFEIFVRHVDWYLDESKRRHDAMRAEGGPR